MKRRNAEFGKLRRPMKRNKIAEGMYGRYNSYYPISFDICMHGSSINSLISAYKIYTWIYLLPPFFVEILSVYMCARASAIRIMFVCMRECMKRLAKAIIYAVCNECVFVFVFVFVCMCKNIRICMCAFSVRG